MATHSSVLAWRIPGTGEPSGLPSLGSQSRTRLKRLSSRSGTYHFSYQAPSRPLPLARTQVRGIAKMQRRPRNYLPGCTAYVATTPDHEGETDLRD